MEPTILISLISSTTAIIIAVWTIVYNHNKEKQRNLDSEAIKLNIEILKEQRIIRKEALKEKENSIYEILSLSQSLKDALSSLRISYFSGETIRNEIILLNKEKISSTILLYSKLYYKLDKGLAGILHDLKKCLFYIDNYLDRYNFKSDTKELEFPDKNILSAQKIIVKIQNILTSSTYLPKMVKNILIVEDEYWQVENLFDYFKDNDFYNLLYASNYGDAASQIECIPIDTIVCDAMIPKGNYFKRRLNNEIPFGIQFINNYCEEKKNVKFILHSFLGEKIDGLNTKSKNVFCVSKLIDNSLDNIIEQII